MRGIAFACFALVPLLTGCSVLGQVAENSAFEKRLYLQDERLEHRVRKDAKDMLREVCHRHPKRNFGKDFLDGFEDGYADFLTYGGPIRPPAQAPPKYRTAKYLSPEGHCMVRDYFQGFQYGSECAQASGRRQFFTHLVLTSEPPPVAPLDIVVLPPPPEDEREKKRKDLNTPSYGPTVPKGEPEPKVEPKIEPKIEPKVDPKPVTPLIPKVMPAAPAVKEPVPTPMAAPPVTPVPNPMPVVPMPVPTAPKAMIPATPVPLPTMPVPVVPASTPAPSIPLVPITPTVSLMGSTSTVVPVGYTTK